MKKIKKITPKKSTWLAQNLYAAKIDDCCYLDFVLVLTFSHKPIAMFRNLGIINLTVTVGTT